MSFVFFCATRQLEKLTRDKNSAMREAFPIPRHLKRIRAQRLENDRKHYSVLLCSVSHLRNVAAARNEPIVLGADGTTALTPAALLEFGVAHLSTIYVSKHAPLSRLQFDSWAVFWPMHTHSTFT